MIDIKISNNYGCDVVVQINGSEAQEAYSSGFLSQIEQLLAMIDQYNSCEVHIVKHLKKEDTMQDPVKVKDTDTISIRNGDGTVNTFSFEKKPNKVWRK